MSGDLILNSDDKIWEINRKVIFSILKHSRFHNNMETIVWNKVENGFVPILGSICVCGTQIDLQDIFQRFAFDNACTILFDIDPKSLSLDFPYIPYSKAFTDGEEAILFRLATPRFLWKVQHILRVGKAKKLSDAWKNLDQFIYKCLAGKQREYNNMNHDAERFVFFTMIMKELTDQSGISLDPTKFLRDTLVNLMAAGKDTIISALSWFFYLLARNPNVEDKILDEIQTHLEAKACRRWNKVKVLDEMVYLHGDLEVIEENTIATIHTYIKCTFSFHF
ncbi:noroxomaritidine synthase 3-like [Bidens hawaiensis]|uniref:noroxomaritidine synthase 3-like n=1 Tax=Bidens hawaiensis TaxID=980011 RepID=UPI00404B7ACD